MVRNLSKDEQFKRNGDTVLSVEFVRATYHAKAKTTRFLFVMKTDSNTSLQTELNARGWASGEGAVNKIIDDLIVSGKKNSV